MQTMPNSPKTITRKVQRHEPLYLRSSFCMAGSLVVNLPFLRSHGSDTCLSICLSTGGTYPGQVQGTYPTWPGQDGVRGYPKVPTPGQVRTGRLPQGTYPPPPNQVRMGEGVPQGTYPWPGQDGRGSTPRYLPASQVRTGEGVPQGTYPPARSGQGEEYPKVPTPQPHPGQGLATWQVVCLLHSHGRTFLVRMGDRVPQGTYPWPGQDGGGSTPRYLPPSQVRTGEGVRQGTYPPSQVRTGGGVPQGTYPPTSPWPRTCYMAGGMPLAFTQENFLVVGSFSTRVFTHNKI